MLMTLKSNNIVGTANKTTDQAAGAANKTVNTATGGATKATGAATGTSRSLQNMDFSAPQSEVLQMLPSWLTRRWKAADKARTA